MSRPHAEEPKEQLCCDSGRAARPSEFGEGALGGGCRPVRGGRTSLGRRKEVGIDGGGFRGEEKANGEKLTGAGWVRFGGWRVRRP